MKEYKFKINGNAYKVAVENVEDGVATVTLNGTTYKVELAKIRRGPCSHLGHVLKLKQN